MLWGVEKYAQPNNILTRLLQSYQQQVDILRAFFNELDADGSGTMDFDAFKAREDGRKGVDIGSVIP